MSSPLPPMATVAELVASAVRVASARVTEGSRRNAREALERRANADQQVAAALTAWAALAK